MRSFMGSLVVVLLAVGCGGSSAQGRAPAAPGDTAVARHLSSARLRLGHYSTGDGMIGFVLDRTGDEMKPKLRMDGSKDIIETIAEAERHGASERGFWLLGEHGDRLVYVGRDGDVRLLRGTEQLPMGRDADADPLGAATKHGTARVEHKTARDLSLEAMQAASVRANFPEYKPQDSANLAKVREAIQKAKPGMFFHVVSAAKTPTYRPGSERIDNSEHGTAGMTPRESETSWDRSKPGLLKYGGVLNAYSEYRAPSVRIAAAGNQLAITNELTVAPSWNGISVEQAKGLPPLAANTPGIIWEVDGGTVVFVTLDGGRYSNVIFGGEESPYAPGLPTGTWPAPLQHALLHSGALEFLAKDGAMSTKPHDDLAALNKGWAQCAANVWNRAKPELTAIETSNISWDTKAGRAKVLRESYEVKVAKECAPPLAKYEDFLVKTIEARNAERLAIYAAAQAKTNNK